MFMVKTWLLPSTALTLIKVTFFLSTMCYVQGNVSNDTHTCKCVTYSFHHKRLTWITSREWCVKNKGDLVSMETREEWNYLKDFIQTLPGLPGLNTEYYIGLRKDRNGSWHWLSNNTKEVSAGPGWPWPDSEPSGDGNCVVMYKNYRGKGLFNDVPCNKSALDTVYIGFICEKTADCTFVNGRIVEKQLTTTSPSYNGKCVVRIAKPE
ncbi:chromatin-modulating protein mrc1 [Desmophyllum pertusum]|uniref:Chromatin-modulating protein mrc1 n=1 Tax=Desmophyllum pertusum TaxID=174260 RepID=A0A9X0CQ25_9CNID|nr:chromatin-modulating protein mrc1 [Desmophyllum pertusum]